MVKSKLFSTQERNVIHLSRGS